MLWILTALEVASHPIPIPPQHSRSRSGGTGDGGRAQGGGGGGGAAAALTLQTVTQTITDCERAELEKVRSYDPSLMLLLQWMTEPVQLDARNPINRADMMDVLRHP